MRKYWICAVLLAFVFGIAIDRVVQRRERSLDRDSALAGIEKLHKLDERVTILNDPKANLEVFTDDAVLLGCGAPVDVGKQAIYATAVRSRADRPGYTITSYKPNVRDVRVVRDGTIPKVGGLYSDAIRQWRFKPATLHGRPVDVQYDVSVIIDVR